ncbi:sensor histidine kinase [Neorhodopirellula lusitana]|uniref:sensor histidine kinase n=1 Tax=Neorhodopirellula lusitana TaxID=445327 RepID=UPI0038511687
MVQLNPSEELGNLLELERQQVAAELHDGLLPYLYAAAAKLSALRKSNPDLDTRLRDVAQWVDQSRETARQLMSGITIPPGVAADPIQAAHEFLVDILVSSNLAVFQATAPRPDDPVPNDPAPNSQKESSETSDLNSNLPLIEWQCGGDRSPLHGRVPESEAIAVYRILIELVRNAVRHAAASHIVVSCQCRTDSTGDSGHEFSIEVKDDGKGFDVDIFNTAASGGLKWMQGRASLAGLELSIQDSGGDARHPNCGTLAVLRGPLATAPAETTGSE